MRIEIVTPSRSLGHFEADALFAQGPRGEFGVLPGHEHYVTPLLPGPLYIVQNNKKIAFYVSGGYLIANPGEVRVLADDIQKASELDAAQLQQQIAQLEKAQLDSSLSSEELATQLAQLREAQGRWQVLQLGQ